MLNVLNISTMCFSSIFFFTLLPWKCNSLATLCLCVQLFVLYWCYVFCVSWGRMGTGSNWCQTGGGSSSFSCYTGVSPWADSETHFDGRTPQGSPEGTSIWPWSKGVSQTPCSSVGRVGFPCTEALSLLQRPRVGVLKWGPLLRAPALLTLFPVISEAVLWIKPYRGKKPTLLEYKKRISIPLFEYSHEMIIMYSSTCKKNPMQEKKIKESTQDF